MSTHTVTLKFRIQKNGLLQLHAPNSEIELLAVNDKDALADAILAAIEQPEPVKSRFGPARGVPDPDGVSIGASDAKSSQDELENNTEPQSAVIDAEPVSEHEADRAAHLDVETHVREAIDGLMPGGSRIIDFLQDLSTKE